MDKSNASKGDAAFSLAVAVLDDLCTIAAHLRYRLSKVESLKPLSGRMAAQNQSLGRRIRLASRSYRQEKHQYQRTSYVHSQLHISKAVGNLFKTCAPPHLHDYETEIVTRDVKLHECSYEKYISFHRHPLIFCQ